MAQINFRKQWNLEHSDDELDYKTPFNPILPYITIVLLAISVLVLLGIVHNVQDSTLVFLL